jgi:hypothetical protein
MQAGCIKQTVQNLQKYHMYNCFINIGRLNKYSYNDVVPPNSLADYAAVAKAANIRIRVGSWVSFIA